MHTLVISEGNLKMRLQGLGKPRCYLGVPPYSWEFHFLSPALPSLPLIASEGGVEQQAQPEVSR